jgi:hypothetical protein
MHRLESGGSFALVRQPKVPRRRGPRHGWLLVAALVHGSACANGPPPESLGAWHDAVIAAQAQSDATLRGVNQLAREAAVGRAAKLGKLTEAAFEPALDSESLTVWHGTFDDLAAYSKALARLVDPATTAAIGPSLRKLSETMAAQANVDAFQRYPGLASAIGRLGAAIAGAAARAEAAEIMRATDPDVSAMLDEMRRMIRDQQDGVEIGVAAVVRATWTDNANEKRVEFLAAPTPDDRLRIAGEYAALLDQRGAADGMLRDVERSLEALAASHGKAAQGSPADLSALVATLREQTLLAQSIVADLRRQP